MINTGKYYCTLKSKEVSEKSSLCAYCANRDIVEIK
ncbi:MAG: DUF2115 family protein [Clostridiales bacterium]|nr:DUF2115 family protein [Clostridiales bacterium]